MTSLMRSCAPLRCYCEHCSTHCRPNKMFYGCFAASDYALGWKY